MDIFFRKANIMMITQRTLKLRMEALHTIIIREGSSAQFVKEDSEYGSGLKNITALEVGILIIFNYIDVFRVE